MRYHEFPLCNTPTADDCLLRDGLCATDYLNDKEGLSFVGTNKVS